MTIARPVALAAAESGRSASPARLRGSNQM